MKGQRCKYNQDLICLRANFQCPKVLYGYGMIPDCMYIRIE